MYIIRPIQLYILLNSTMKKENHDNFPKGGAVCTVPPLCQNHKQKHYFSLAQNLAELLSLQYEVNHKLLINNILIEQFVKQIDENNAKASSSEGSTLVGAKQKNAPGDNAKRPPDFKNNDRRKKQKITYRIQQESSCSQYQPSQDQQVIVQYKLSQSKNVPKNYGKSILAFIKKNKTYTTKVLASLNINQEDFMFFLSQYKNNINTIAQLRSLWIQSQKNPYAKALRIITSQYLRKHSLGHIFNSRVENYGKHVKYRQKILKSLEKPEEFTQMKDF